MKPIVRDAAHALALALVAVAGSGCVSLEPLRTQRYRDVTVEQLEKASTSTDQDVLSGVHGLLQNRLASPDDVELDLALEALVCLRAQRRDASFSTIERCAVEDVAEEVRYVALDALLAVDRLRALPVIEKRIADDPSRLVRDHAAELAGDARTAGGRAPARG